MVIVPARQDRPNLPEASGCPFCVGGLEAAEPYLVKAFPNRWPAMAGGRCEVVLYSADHRASLGDLGAEQAAALVGLWAERTRVLGARPDVAYVLVFENRGREAGATIDHPHGQIYAYPQVPPVPAAELAQPVCALCQAPAEELVVSRGGGWCASVPRAAGWPFEMLIGPEAHLADLPEIDRDPRTRSGLAGALRDAASRLDRLFGQPMPYMLWIHQRPTDGGRWERAHVHVHLCPLLRERGTVRFVAAAEQGGGILFNPVDPQDAAARLRAVGG